MNEETRLGLTAELLNDTEAMFFPRKRETYFVKTALLPEIRKITTYRDKFSTLANLTEMDVVEMPNQKEDCWVIGSGVIAQAYKAGQISEESLKIFFDFMKSAQASCSERLT